MKQVIFIAFSDLHIHDWSKFNSDNKRTQNHFRVLSLIKEVCLKYQCPALFCGDLYHKPDNISQNLLGQSLAYFTEMDFNILDKFKIYGISGNHDMTSIAKIGSKDLPVSWLSIFSKEFKFIQCIDFKCKHLNVHGVDIDLFGVPYIDHNIGLNDYLKQLKLNPDRKNILLLHTDYPGAKDTDGSEVGTAENINLNMLSKFDLVLCGHIHKPQRLSKKVYMIGAPLQQRRTDKDCDLGYWKVYDDLSMVFVPLSEEFPKFIDVESQDKIQEDGNYYTVVSPKVVAMDNLNTNNINKGLSKKRIVRRYLKDKNITDKKKESILLDIIKESEND